MTKDYDNDKFNILKSTAYPLPIENVDTDQIIPARFLKATERKGFGDNLFRDWRYNSDGSPKTDFVLNNPKYSGKILVGGKNFGSGSSREHAAWSVYDFGFRCVISSFFADIFKNNCLNVGVLPVQVSAKFAQKIFDAIDADANTEIEVNLQEQSVTLVATRESESFDISVYKKDKKNVYKDVYNIEENNDTIYIYKKDIIEYNKSGYKKRYYDFYGVNNVNDACENYITGLYWILGYYHNHFHNNWSWFYKYREIPFASDIFNYLNKNEHYTVIKEDTPNTTLEQLIMVLPKKSLLNIIEKKDVILYKKMVRIFNTYSNYLNEYYPDQICLDMIHKEFMWQSKIFLKDFQNNFLENFGI